MSGSTLGTLFAVTNFGESHGPAIGCVIDGCPPGMALAEQDIQPDLDRRRPGTNPFVTQRDEADRVEILSGVYEGRTTGTPIALLIRNTDPRSKDYGDIAQSFRPGHADYAYWRKYGLRDPRGGGRASARLTAPTVAAGAVAKKWLRQQFGTVFRACVMQIGEVKLDFEGWEHVERNPFFAPIANVSAIENYMAALRKAGDSCGARLHAVAQQVPAGLGEPLYDRLDADIAHALMGLNAVKGVEIGDGFTSAGHLGSRHGDAMRPVPDGVPPRSPAAHPLPGPLPQAGEGEISPSPSGERLGWGPALPSEGAHAALGSRLCGNDRPGGGAGNVAFTSNHDGGVQGGISNGQDIEVSVAFKPTSSILIPRPSVDVHGHPVEVVTKGRHDPCVGLRAAPIVEALLALVLMEHALRHRAQCGS
ncbi:MAG: chorismate synthase [Burkholderiaceae bacterium]|jgi:chorismate synthase|nr:chorismate synthase [Burkholderiaceae bacterium]